jgi:hypothetical protein
MNLFWEVLFFLINHDTETFFEIFIFASCILNIKIPLLKPTDAHFCNYINSKNRLKLHYTL